MQRVSRLIPLWFLTLLLVHPSIQQYNNHLLFELLLEWDEESYCPGTVAIFDHFYWTEDVDFIDQLVQSWRGPLTLLQHHNKALVLEEDSWGVDVDVQTTRLQCTNVVIFSRSAQALGAVHREVIDRFPHIGRIIVVTQGPSDAADRFLYEYGRTKYHVLLVFDQPWARHVETRTCCYGPDRHVRRRDYEPKSKSSDVEQFL